MKPTQHLFVPLLAVILITTVGLQSRTEAKNEDKSGLTFQSIEGVWTGVFNRRGTNSLEDDGVVTLDLTQDGDQVTGTGTATGWECEWFDNVDDIVIPRSCELTVTGYCVRERLFVLDISTTNSNISLTMEHGTTAVLDTSLNRLNIVGTALRPENETGSSEMVRLFASVARQ